MTAVTFSSDGYKLAGNLFQSQTNPKDGAFLFIQGWTGRQNLDAAQAVADLGYTTMTYDMRGHGDSEGNIAEFSRADFVHDAGVAYDYLRQQVGETAWIGIVGGSFGGYTAVRLLAERELRCISLRVPANFPDDGYDQPQQSQRTPEEARAWWSTPRSFEENTTLAILHNFSGKVQIVESGADEVIPHQTPQNYANAVADKSLLQYEVMPDAPHRLATDELRADYRERLVKWVDTLTASQPSSKS